MMPEEPDLVAMLVLEGTPYIEATLRSVLGPYGVSVNVVGVFCHQKPIVTFGGMAGGCELGDVLFVHRHRTGAGAIVGRSLLLQAKMGSGAYVRLKAADRLQLELYEAWPAFTYKRAGGLSGASRNVSPKAAHAGAQYLVIDDLKSGIATSGLLGMPNTHCMAVSPAGNLLIPCESLASELVRVLEGSSGREYIDDIAKDHSGWSQVVSDLLQVAKASVFRRGHIAVRAGRYVGDQTASLAEIDGAVSVGFGAPADDTSLAVAMLQQLATEVPPPGMTDAGLYDSEPAGISVVIIETRSET